ncbi:unnamed protein product [Aphanomyces euteiches]
MNHELSRRLTQLGFKAFDSWTGRMALPKHSTSANYVAKSLLCGPLPLPCRRDSTKIGALCQAKLFDWSRMEADAATSAHDAVSENNDSGNDSGNEIGVEMNPATTSSSSEVHPKLGKKALRRQKREQLWISVKERKKRKKEEAKASRPPVVEAPLDMSEAAVLMRKERSIMKRESFLMRVNEGASIVIDCGFDNAMTSREMKSLSQQVMFSYGANKRSESPASVFLTSLRGELESNMRNIAGFSTWLGFTATAQSYMDVFHKDRLVYLTADSPNVITDLDVNKVYIIGGIVDRNRLKGATYEKAQQQGIATAKLPLDQVLEMGQSTRVLTVNHGVLVKLSEV